MIIDIFKKKLIKSEEDSLLHHKANIKLIITKIEGDLDCRKKLMGMGIIPGSYLIKRPFSDCQKLVINIGETRVMLGKNMAEKIICKKL